MTFKNFSKVNVAILLVLTLPASVSYSQNQNDVVYLTLSGTAEFTSRVPLHTFTGESGNLVGMIDLERNMLDFYLDLTTLRTGIDRRDRDMFRTLDVDNYQFAEFTGTIENSFDPNSPEKQSVTALGEFTVHGVTRDVRIDGYLQNVNGKLLLEAEWELDITDYDIEPPGILFYRVNEIQEMRIEAELEPQLRDEVINESS